MLVKKCDCPEIEARHLKAMVESPTLPFKISVLVFLKDAAGQHLLIKRAKAPNLGCWSPVGGKLEMPQGESPFECAVREVGEETSHLITALDLHLFGMVSERGYEGSTHWLMFLFDCRKPLTALPPDINEGQFGFFTRDAINALHLPATDRKLLWPVWDQHRGSFLAFRAECDPKNPLVITEEESHLRPHLD